MINIFEYLDYRFYLHDYWQSAKKEKSHFSIRFIANKVGLNPGYVIKVFQSQVHLGAKNIPVFAELLGLKGKEYDYFEELVHFGRAKNENEIEQRFERLNSIKGISMRTVADNAAEFYQKWYHMAIRSLISIYPFDGKHCKRLGSLLTPPITASEARQSIKLLEKLTLIKKGPDGIYVLTEQFVSTGEKWMSPIIKKYQIKNIELAIESLQNHDKSLRDISTVTMTFAHKHMPELREKVRKFRQELLKMSNDITDEDSVMQLNIQVFPSAIIPRGGEGK